MKIQLTHNYEHIISLENLLAAWTEFSIGKKSKSDVQAFELQVMDHIVDLHHDLVNQTYQHGGYHSFFVHDPKRRHIHKASVRDRLLHHAVYRTLSPFFDRTFIADSYSCRENKGTHRAINRFQSMALQVSKNHTRTCWVLKCDIRKFFASVDHTLLITMLRAYIPDERIVQLLENIIGSFHTETTFGVGLPLGNLTSQLFANVYMNGLDQWVKHTLKARQYIRYADDFVFLSEDKQWLEESIPKIQTFLQSTLRLSLHPDKLFLKTSVSGVDFLGWVHFPDHRVLRTKTRQRMFRRITDCPKEAVFQSYIGLLLHGDTHKVETEVRNLFWLLTDSNSSAKP